MTQLTHLTPVQPRFCLNCLSQFDHGLLHFLSHQVIDTPDVFNLGGDDAGAELTFREWEKLIVSPGPIAFLFVVRLDLRFTPNDYDLYKRYRKLLPRHLRNNNILGFTRVDDLPGPVECEITLSDVQTLLNDCQRRHVTFNVPKAEQRGDREQVEQIQDKIMDWMTKMPSKMSWFDRGLAAMRSGVSELSRGTLGHFITRSRRTIGVSPSRCALCVIGAATFIAFLYFYFYQAGTDQSLQSYNLSQANGSDLKR